jgi:putative ABC transport system permease protein
MNYLSRSINSLWRGIWRNVLLSAVIASAAALLGAMLGLNAASESAIEVIRDEAGVSVKAYRMGEGGGSGDIDPRGIDPTKKSSYFPYGTAKKIAGLRHVRDSRYFGAANAKEGQGIRGVRLYGEDVAPENAQYGIFKLNGLTDTADFWFFRSGAHQLLEGRFLSKEDEGMPYAVISSMVAGQSSLGVGDVFTVSSYLYPDREAQLEVVGIHSGEFQGFTPEFMNPWNYIYTPVSAAAYVSGGGIMEAEFYLDDPYGAQAFIEEAEAIAEEDGASLGFFENPGSFLAASAPLAGFRKVCGAITLSAALMSLFLLCAMVAYFTSERAPEIGVLLSLGEARRRIVLQLAIEVLAPVLAGISLGCLASWALAPPLEAMLGSRIELLGGLDISLGVGARDALLMYAWGIALTAAASALPALRILRYRPREILQRP